MVGYLYVPLTTWFGHRLGKVEEAATSELETAPLEPSGRQHSIEK
jgi:hypothetical protein